MKCEAGDMAKIIHALTPANIGKTVHVAEYIGHFKKNTIFDFRGMPCKAVVTDHYWWIEAEFGLYTLLGQSPKAYIADTWLEPLRPTAQTTTSKEDIEIEA